MNIALSAIIIFILLSPGVAFRIAYLKSDSLQFTLDTSILGEFLFIIVPTLFFNAIYFIIIEVSASLLNFDFRLDQLYYIMSGASDDIEFDLLERNIIYFVLYVLLSTLFAGVMGRVSQLFVIKKNLDESFPSLRVANHWDYLFTGRIKGHQFANLVKMKDSFVKIDALVSTENEDILYSGILDKFFLSKEQGLEKIYLIEVYRKKFSPEEPSALIVDENYHMIGDYLVIPYSSIKNINVTYYLFEEEKENNAEQSN